MDHFEPMTTLTRNRTPEASLVRVVCLSCGRMLRLSDAVIDLDGPAFLAYYHEECQPTHDEEGK